MGRSFLFNISLSEELINCFICKFCYLIYKLSVLYHAVNVIGYLRLDPFGVKIKYLKSRMRELCGKKVNLEVLVEHYKLSKELRPVMSNLLA